MTKKVKTNKETIEENRKKINILMRESLKSIDTIHMLRHEISDTEPQILFKHNQENKQISLDFANMTNLSTAWQYILDNKKQNIDVHSIATLHSILCRDTSIKPFTYRTTMAYSLGQPAPLYEEIFYKMENIIYELHYKHTPILTRAFNLHYDMILTQPFEDYNKRTARLVMNWFLIQNGYRPVIFNHKSDSTNYTNALHARIDGDHRAYTAYMEKCMIRTQSMIIKLLTHSL